MHSDCHGLQITYCHYCVYYVHTGTPSRAPSASTDEPTDSPSPLPTLGPTSEPSMIPTSEPSAMTDSPTTAPTRSKPPTTCEGTLSGFYGITISVEIHWFDDTVDITLYCPDNRWCGCGFNAEHMSDNPYAIIVNSDRIIETHLENYEWSAALHTTTYLIDHGVMTGAETMATITISRDASLAFDYDTISANGNQIKLIWAVSLSGANEWAYGM